MVTYSYRYPGVIQNFFCCLSMSRINFKHPKKKVLSCDLKILDFSVNSSELICPIPITKLMKPNGQRSKFDSRHNDKEETVGTHAQSHT